MKNLLPTTMDMQIETIHLTSMKMAIIEKIDKNSAQDVGKKHLHTGRESVCISLEAPQSSEHSFCMLQIEHSSPYARRSLNHRDPC